MLVAGPAAWCCPLSLPLERRLTMLAIPGSRPSWRWPRTGLAPRGPQPAPMQGSPAQGPASGEMISPETTIQLSGVPGGFEDSPDDSLLAVTLADGPDASV